MEIVGVALHRPKWSDVATAAVIAGMTCVAAIALTRLVGGNWTEVLALTAAGLASSLASTCGAAYRWAGMRGLALSVASAAAAYGAVMSIIVAGVS